MSDTHPYDDIPPPDLHKVVVQSNDGGYNQLDPSFTEWFKHYGLDPVQASWQEIDDKLTIDWDLALENKSNKTVVWDTMPPEDGPSYFYFVDSETAMLFKLTFGG